MAKSKRSIDRRRKLVAKKERDERRQQNLLPSYEIDVGTAPPSLVDAVRTAVLAVERDCKTVLGKPVLEFLHLGRRCGFPAAVALIDKYVDHAPGGRQYQYEAYLGVGQAIFDRIPRPLVEAHLPYHTFDVLFGEPQPHQMKVRFRSLLRSAGSNGSVYHSRRRPTVRVGGRDLVVGFSDHAVRRVCDRAAFNWRTYAGSGHAFAYLDDCVYFEDVSPLFGEPCFAVYGQCAPGFVGGALAERVLGRPVAPRDHLYYRIGYCPSVIEGGFLKAKTLLLPGMDRTPEGRALENAQLPPLLKASLRASLELFFAPGRLSTDVLTVQGWFHRNGVPQVVSIDRPVFQFE
ncbi:MAG TPA: hypothetical protein VGE74_28025 [Gemmata sp.]